MSGRPAGATLADPYISLVIASRNDGYAGGMLRRLQVCLDSFLTQVERVRLSAELVLVDWNPPPGRTLFDALTWPPTPRHCSVRVITVPAQQHDALPFGDRLPILIARARNVGIRRARGASVLPTSPDILLSDELIDVFARRELNPGAMYRIARHDVPEAVLAVAGHEARLRYCSQHVLHVHERDKSLKLPGLPQLFTNGAGDFTLLSRDSYRTLRGIPEEREYHSMHFDSVFCFIGHAAGLRETVFTEPCRIYHVDHGLPSWVARPSLLERLVRKVPLDRRRSKRLVKWARRVMPSRSGIDRRGVPYLDLSTTDGRARYEELIRAICAAGGGFRYNDADWGLGNAALDERVLG